MQNEVLGVNWPVNERTTNQTKLKLLTIVGDVSQKYKEKSPSTISIQRISKLI